MSRSERRQNTRNAIARQLRVARHAQITKYLEQPGRLKKHHAMDCGNPRCGLCGNPRRSRGAISKEALTVQELSALEQLKQGLREVAQLATLNEEAVC